jgi:hypothetical protein
MLAASRQRRMIWHLDRIVSGLCASVVAHTHRERSKTVIVNRRTFIAKQGCVQGLLDVLKAELETNPSPVPCRVYASSIARFDQVAVEWEFESLAAYEKFWADWFARPETPAFMDSWYPLNETGGKNEIWTLET